MLIRLFPRTKLPDNVSFVAFTPQHVLVDDQTLQSHRPSGMYSARANPHFRPKPESEAIREARAGVDKRASRIYAPCEYRRRQLVLGHDGICVMGRMRVDKLNSFVDG